MKQAGGRVREAAKEKSFTKYRTKMYGVKDFSSLHRAIPLGSFEMTLRGIVDLLVIPLRQTLRSIQYHIYP